MRALAPNEPRELLDAGHPIHQHIAQHVLQRWGLGSRQEPGQQIPNRRFLPLPGLGAGVHHVHVHDVLHQAALTEEVLGHALAVGRLEDIHWRPGFLIPHAVGQANAEALARVGKQLLQFGQ